VKILAEAALGGVFGGLCASGGRPRGGAPGPFHV